MVDEQILVRLLAALVEGDRAGSRQVVEEVLQRGVPVQNVYRSLIWPMLNTIDRLMQQERISPVQEHMATRTLRQIVDQLQNKLPRRPRTGRKVVICCGDQQSQELGAQLMADVFESDGWDVRLLGGGLSNDDILGFVHEYAPDLLLICGIRGKNAPQVRQLIDTIRAVNAWPNMKIMLSGGVFARAEGLWEEIGADAYAADPHEAVAIASGRQPMPVAIERTINRRRKKKPSIQVTFQSQRRPLKLSAITFAE